MLVIRTPQLPVGIQHAKVLHWRRKVGDAVGRNVELVDLQIDGKFLSVRSPRAGIVEKIQAVTGQLVAAQDVLAVIKDGLPVFDPEAELDIDPQYALSAQEFSVSSQVELQQLLGESAVHANRIHSQLPKWEQRQQGDLGMGQHLENGVEAHPKFANKSAGRSEVNPYPADMESDHLHAARLQYEPNPQPQPSSIPSPRPK